MLRPGAASVLIAIPAFEDALTYGWAARPAPYA
jgi:hypothetical protein